MARRTPLFDAHRALGARLVEFAGWEMPLCYRGAAEEHRAVRERCGLFDVSHMGEIELGTLTALDLGGLRPFTALEGTVAGVKTIVSRTGYTGEDGFELLSAAPDAPPLWAALLEATRRRDGLPAGLGARDTLRLEAGLPLCGTDMDETTTPLEAGLAWVVKLDKGDFVGRAVLAGQAARGVARRLVGLELAEPGIPRHGYPVWRDGAAVGTVTSGTRSPTLGTYIGLAYVTADAAAPGTPVAVDIRR